MKDGDILPVPHAKPGMYQFYVVHDGEMVARRALHQKIGKHSRKVTSEMQFRFPEQMRLEFPRGPKFCMEFQGCRRLKAYIERDIENHPVYRYRLRRFGKNNDHIVLDFLAYRQNP